MNKSRQDEVGVPPQGIQMWSSAVLQGNGEAAK